MNSLGRNLKAGDRVVVSKQYYKGDLLQRIVTVHDGFGMMSFTSGTAISARFESDGEEVRIDGFELDPEETAAINGGIPK